MATKNRLELTWIGKDERPRLEPRILLEDPAKGHHRPGPGIHDNRLIFGDNLLALKALEQEFTGKVKCVYIDPPFNTKQDFTYYQDGLEHSTWLCLIRDRVECLHRLLSEDGTLAVHIDDNELGYLIVLLDEVFGRPNRINIVTFKQGAPTGHKAINSGCVTTSNYIVLYAKDRSRWIPNKIYTEVPARDTRYAQFLKNRERDIEEWAIVPLASAFAESIGVDEAAGRKVSRQDPSLLDRFVLDNARSVIRFARPDYDAVSGAARALIDASKAAPGRVFHLQREGMSDFYFLRGERILFYADKLKMVNGRLVVAEALTTIWDDLLSNNLHNEGGVSFPKGKKPEALLKRVIELATSPGDLVVDSFAGSGTTGAVAHKMGRRWIMVELGEHCHTHIIPRLQKVIDGADSGGVTEATGWQGGGGFRYFRLAPSLLEKDPWGEWVVSKQYNPAMLAEAVCKHEGFRYEPSQEVYWQHGRSTERDYIFVTTQTLTREQLTVLADHVGSQRSLLVCCGAFRAGKDEFANLTLKKIPQAVLHRCEWGKDDYSLNITERSAESDDDAPVTSAAPAKAKPGRPKATDTSTLSLFDRPEPPAPTAGRGRAGKKKP